jgi:hypothetical protein
MPSIANLVPFADDDLLPAVSPLGAWGYSVESALSALEGGRYAARQAPSAALSRGP